MKNTTRTLTQSRGCALAMALLVGCSLPQTAVSQSFFDSLINKGKELFAAAKDMADLAIQKGEDVGKKNREAQAKSKKHLEEQMEALKKNLTWVESFKKQVEDQVGQHLENAMAAAAKAKAGVASAAEQAKAGVASAAEQAKAGVASAAEQAREMKRQLVMLVVAAKAHQANQTKKVMEAKDVVNEQVGSAVEKSKNALGGAVEGAHTWALKFKGDLTSLAQQAKDAFDANGDGVMEMSEWDSLANAFGFDADVDANNDGAVSPDELEKALEGNIEKLGAQITESSGDEASESSDNKKHDEM